MSDHGLPIEVEEWPKETSAHKEAAERIGTFYETILDLCKSENAALMLTQGWMMIAYGVPKNMPGSESKE